VIVEKTFDAPQSGRHDILLLGSAGQRIITAGEILCLAGLTAGLHATQKNEYNITVLRGPSISEMILSEDRVDYAGIDIPNVIIALSQEGVDRRKPLFDRLNHGTLILQAPEVNLPSTHAEVFLVDFKTCGIKPHNWALAALATLAKQNRVISTEMLNKALTIRFRGDVLESVLKLLNQMTTT
jgi:Pyruvate/2-oxoacid:ferredoxin oxidoreductase gamma subunit